MLGMLLSVPWWARWALARRERAVPGDVHLLDGMDMKVHAVAVHQYGKISSVLRDWNFCWTPQPESIIHLAVP